MFGWINLREVAPHQSINKCTGQNCVTFNGRFYLKNKLKFTWYTRTWGWRTLNENAQALKQAGKLASYWLMSTRNEDKNLQILRGHGFR